MSVCSEVDYDVYPCTARILRDIHRQTRGGGLEDIDVLQSSELGWLAEGGSVWSSFHKVRASRDTIETLSQGGSDLSNDDLGVTPSRGSVGHGSASSASASLNLSAEQQQQRRYRHPSGPVSRPPVRGSFVGTSMMAQKKESLMSDDNHHADLDDVERILRERLGSASISPTGSQSSAAAPAVHDSPHPTVPPPLHTLPPPAGGYQDVDLDVSFPSSVTSSQVARVVGAMGTAAFVDDYNGGGPSHAAGTPTVVEEDTAPRPHRAPHHTMNHDPAAQIVRDESTAGSSPPVSHPPVERCLVDVDPEAADHEEHGLDAASAHYTRAYPPMAFTTEATRTPPPAAAGAQSSRKQSPAEIQREECGGSDAAHGAGGHATPESAPAGDAALTPPSLRAAAVDPTAFADAHAYLADTTPVAARDAAVATPGTSGSARSSRSRTSRCSAGAASYVGPAPVAEPRSVRSASGGSPTGAIPIGPEGEEATPIGMEISEMSGLSGGERATPLPVYEELGVGVGVDASPSSRGSASAAAQRDDAPTPAGGGGGWDGYERIALRLREEAAARQVLARSLLELEEERSRMEVAQAWQAGSMQMAMAFKPIAAAAAAAPTPPPAQPAVADAAANTSPTATTPDPTPRREDGGSGARGAAGASAVPVRFTISEWGVKEEQPAAAAATAPAPPTAAGVPGSGRTSSGSGGSGNSSSDFRLAATLRDMTDCVASLATISGVPLADRGYDITLPRAHPRAEVGSHVVAAAATPTSAAVCSRGGASRPSVITPAAPPALRPAHRTIILPRAPPSGGGSYAVALPPSGYIPLPGTTAPGGDSSGRVGEHAPQTRAAPQPVHASKHIHDQLQGCEVNKVVVKTTYEHGEVEPGWTPEDETLQPQYDHHAQQAAAPAAAPTAKRGAGAGASAGAGTSRSGGSGALHDWSHVEPKVQSFRTRPAAPSAPTAPRRTDTKPTVQPQPYPLRTVALPGAGLDGFATPQHHVDTAVAAAAAAAAPAARRVHADPVAAAGHNHGVDIEDMYGGMYMPGGVDGLMDADVDLSGFSEELPLRAPEAVATPPRRGGAVSTSPASVVVTGVEAETGIRPVHAGATSTPPQHALPTPRTQGAASVSLRARAGTTAAHAAERIERSPAGGSGLSPVYRAKRARVDAQDAAAAQPGANHGADDTPRTRRGRGGDAADRDVAKPTASWSARVGAARGASTSPPRSRSPGKGRGGRGRSPRGGCARYSMPTAASTARRHPEHGEDDAHGDQGDTSTSGGRARRRGASPSLTAPTAASQSRNKLLRRDRQKFERQHSADGHRPPFRPSSKSPRRKPAAAPHGHHHTAGGMNSSRLSTLAAPTSSSLKKVKPPHAARRGEPASDSARGGGGGGPVSHDVAAFHMMAAEAKMALARLGGGLTA